MRRNCIWLAILAILAGLVTLCACSSSSDNTTSPPPASSTTTTENPAEVSSQVVAVSSAEAAKQKDVDDKLAAIKAQVNAASSPEARLGMIITMYCKLQANPSDTDESVLIGLAQLYKNLWQAGNHWRYPLTVALQQTDACPTATTGPSTLPHT